MDYNKSPFFQGVNMRRNNRPNIELRPIKITRFYTKFAEGSVLIECGDTRVLCTASTIAGVPPFLKNMGQGWVTAEYGMLPRATGTRTAREASRGKQSGRTQEIQRLIGRSLRAAVNLAELGENTIQIDCDVLQADGGTRTASITGGCIALYDAIQSLIKKSNIPPSAFKQFVAAISVGITQGTPVLDLELEEDVGADTDMNVVMAENGGFIEVQGTAEKGAFNRAQLDELLELSQTGIRTLLRLQKEAVS